MWVIGHLAYGVAIMTANFTLMLRFHNFTGWGELFVYGSILSYFSLLYGEGLFSYFQEIYYVFDVMFTSPLIWLNMFLATAACNIF